MYEQYSAETGKINETRGAIIKEYSDEYGTLTDDQADNLIRRWLDRHGAALTFENAGISLATSAAIGVLEEFVLRKVTSHRQ